MNRIFSAKSIAAAAVVLGAFGAATAAHARTDVFLNIGVPITGAYVQPAPVYVQPQPVYVAPRLVQVQPHYGHARQAGWDRRGPYGDRDRDGVINLYDRHDDRRHVRHVQVRGPWGDADHDGVANRFDRFPGNPYRR